MDTGGAVKLDGESEGVGQGDEGEEMEVVVIGLFEVDILVVLLVGVCVVEEVVNEGI